MNSRIDPMLIKSVEEFIAATEKRKAEEVREKQTSIEPRFTDTSAASGEESQHVSGLATDTQVTEKNGWNTILTKSSTIGVFALGIAAVGFFALRSKYSSEPMRVAGLFRKH